jgi:hypothetical protein
VRAAGRTDCRCRAPETCCLRLHSKHSTTELVCRFQKSSSLPKIDEEVSGSRRFFGRPQLQGRFRRERSKRAAALAAHRTLGRRVFHLLEAAVRTFRTDFCRRWIGHCMLAETFLLRARSECRLHRLAGPHNFRARCSFCGNGTGGDFRFPDKGCSFFNY